VLGRNEPHQLNEAEERLQQVKSDPSIGTSQRTLSQPPPPPSGMDEPEADAIVCPFCDYKADGDYQIMVRFMTY
jgi:hypothetical protein